MAATSDPNEVITLPRLRPGDLATLIVELASTSHALSEELAATVRAAKKKHPPPADDATAAALPDVFPARIAEAAVDMTATRPALADALAAAGPDTRLTPEQHACDLQMNASWRCVRLAYELGEQRANMAGDDTLAGKYRAAHKRVLPDGIGFIRMVGRDEYTVSDTALNLLENEQAGLFRTLPGGDELMRDVRRVHDAYGAAFHITAAAPVNGPESPTLAPAIAAAAAATREYVAAVVGSVRRADPRTRALADRLLAPLANYGRTPKDPAATPTGAANSEPTPPGTPDPSKS